MVGADGLKIFLNSNRLDWLKSTPYIVGRVFKNPRTDFSARLNTQFLGEKYYFSVKLNLVKT